jgi:hypothetical protein
MDHGAAEADAEIEIVEVAEVAPDPVELLAVGGGGESVSRKAAARSPSASAWRSGTSFQPASVVGPTKLIDSTSNGPGIARPTPSMRPLGRRAASAGTMRGSRGRRCRASMCGAVAAGRGDDRRRRD